MIFPILFLKLLIFAFSLLFFVCLARGLPILLFFLKNQFLVSLIFTIVFMFPNHWLLLLFLLFLLFCLICVYFDLVFLVSRSRSLDYELRPFFYSNISIKCFKLSTSTAFIVSHKFWYVVFLFSHSSKYFLIYLKACSLTMFEYFLLFFCYWFLA